MKRLFVVIAIILMVIMTMGNGCIFGPDDEKNDEPKTDNNVAEQQNVAEQDVADQNLVEPAENTIQLPIKVVRINKEGKFVRNFENVTVWTNDPEHQAINTDIEGMATLIFPEGTGEIEVHAECGWTEKIMKVDVSIGYSVVFVEIYPYENLIFLPVKVVKINNDGSAENYEGATVWSNAALEYVDGLKTNAVNTDPEGMATLVFSKHAGEVKIHAECGWTEKVLAVDISQRLDLLLVQVK